MAKAKRKPKEQETKEQPQTQQESPGTELVVSTGAPPAKPEPVSVEIDRYRGIAAEPLPKEVARGIMAPIDPIDVEIRPDGVLYYPEIKYRRVLNTAVGPMGWALAPRSSIDKQEYEDGREILSREYGLFIHGRFVAEARGEQEYHPNNPQMTYPSALEGVKSNALMRCCKDIGIASELWDPNFIIPWLEKYAVKVWVNNKDKPQWRRQDRPPFWNERGPVDKQKDQQTETPQQSGPGRVRGKIENMTEKKGTKNNKPWVNYGVVIGGVTYGSFDSKVAEFAREAKKRDLAVEIAYEQKGNWKTITEISAVEGTMGSGQTGKRKLGQYHQELKDRLEKLVDQPTNEFTRKDIPGLLKELTSWESYTKTDASGKERKVDGFSGVTDFDDTRFSEKMAMAALGKIEKAEKAMGATKKTK